jgi:hypothetical protein
MAFVARRSPNAELAPELFGSVVADEALPGAESVFADVEPVLRTLTVPIHRASPEAEPKGPSAARGGAVGGCQKGLSPGFAVALALVITLVILILVLFVRRSRGCGHGAGFRFRSLDGFAPCCSTFGAM